VGPPRRRVLATLTAFTAAHSLTLALSPLNLVHLPQPPVEACIALSLVLLARAVVLGDLSHGTPWRFAGACGLLHGLGFAGALADIGLPDGRRPAARSRPSTSASSSARSPSLSSIGLLAALPPASPRALPLRLLLAYAHRRPSPAAWTPRACSPSEPPHDPHRLALLLALAPSPSSPATASPRATYDDPREPCADRNPRRNLYWGDLHVHTAYSFDAWISEVRTDPAGAYRFARGEEVAGHQLPRPLDFAAVTDHAEYLAEVDGCTTPGSAVYTTDRCVGYRAATNGSLAQFGLGLDGEDAARFEDLCGPGALDCDAAAAAVWSRVQDAAEQAYDRSAACEFTSLVAYEWSGSRELSNLHRNVIFRTRDVPPLPISHFEAPTAHELWTRLQTQCRDQLPGCDVLAIPHNSNWSNGNLFIPEAPAGTAPAALARLRADLEPLIEVYQHKGDSECMNGIGGLGEPDEYCDFEKLRTGDVEDCGDGTGTRGMLAMGCVSSLDFLRGVLIKGLQEEKNLGINPYRLGVIASTDTHNGTPGMVEEPRYAGHFGTREGDPTTRLTGVVPAGPRNSPGGVVAVWAEENSRESLFDALRRREVYGTSGPRIAVRMFAAWDLPADLCDRPDLVDIADDAGVPMGGLLTGTGTSPKIVVAAQRDVGTSDLPGLGLERVQIIKGWLDKDGAGHITVHDLAASTTEASVDEATCAQSGAGADTLCGVWTDPAHDPDPPDFLLRPRPRDPDLPVELARLPHPRRGRPPRGVQRRDPPPHHPGARLDQPRLDRPTLKNPRAPARRRPNAPAKD
jgi:hypothetical protein